MNRILSFLIIVLSLITLGCSDVSELNNIQRSDGEVELAIPLVNTEFLISDFTSGEDAPDNVSILIDEQDRVTLVYNGDVVRQDIDAVFPSLPEFGFPLLDTVFTVPVPFATDQQVDVAVFGDSNMEIAFNSQFEEDVMVTVEIPQLSFEGEVFREQFTINYEGTTPVEFRSPIYALKGYELRSETNEITVRYDARLGNGDRVRFVAAAVSFDQVKFDYVEGYFGRELFDISGDFVPVGVLDLWKSGGLSFTDPKVNIFVENAFGFPVRSKFNTMQVVTTTNEVLDMESDLITENIDFDYPTLNEIGQFKITEFAFTKDNSNIVDLFEERVVRVTYDIDAEANPDDDDSIIGFIDTSSYFLVNVNVELPLEGTVNNLVLQDTIDLDLTGFDEVKSAEFKSVVANDFPADITIQGFFLTEDGELLDSLFRDEFVLPAGLVDTQSGITNAPGERTTFTDFDTDQFEKLKKTKKLLVNVKINTEAASDGPLWIYNSYGIDFKIGAKMLTDL